MKTLITLITITLLSSGCKKERIESGNVTFYQMDYPEKFMYLFVDDKGVDLIGASDHIPSCQESVTYKIINVKLTYGTHKYYLKNSVTKSDIFYVDVNSECQIIKIERK